LARTPDGEVVPKLLDFGIIKLAQANSTNQTGTHFIGTFRYAPPEQILGREITPRADLYAAALVLYEMLAGRSPFEEFRNDIDIGKAQVDRQPPPLSTFVSVPPALDRLVQSALAKDPQAQLRQELKGAASDVHDKATVAAVVTSLTGIPENQPNSVLSDDQVSDFPRPVLQTPTVMTPGATNAPTTPLMAGAPYNGTLLSPQQAPIGATQLMPAPAFASTLPLNARQPDDRLSHASVQSAQSVPLVAPPLRPSADALPIPLVPPTPTFVRAQRSATTFNASGALPVKPRGVGGFGDALAAHVGRCDRFHAQRSQGCGTSERFAFGPPTIDFSVLYDANTIVFRQ
jgi:serine/threonine protein kinase